MTQKPSLNVTSVFQFSRLSSFPTFATVRAKKPKLSASIRSWPTSGTFFYTKVMLPIPDVELVIFLLLDSFLNKRQYVVKHYGNILRQARKISSISNNRRHVTVGKVFTFYRWTTFIFHITSKRFIVTKWRDWKLAKKLNSKKLNYLFKVQVQGRQNVGRVPEEEVRV